MRRRHYRNWRRTAEAILFYIVIILEIALWLFVSTLQFNGIV